MTHSPSDHADTEIRETQVLAAAPLVMLIGALGLACSAWAATGAPTPVLIIGIVAVVASSGLRWYRHGRRGLEIDFLEPAGFPVLYIALSAFLPAWFVLIQHEKLMVFPVSLYAGNTAVLLTAAVLCFAAGAQLASALVSSRSSKPPAHDSLSDVEVRRVHFVSRLMLLGLIVFALLGLATGGVHARTLNQSSYQVSDSLKAMAMIAAVPAVVLNLLCAQRLGYGTRRILDPALIAVLVISSALGGGRSTAIAVLLIVTYYVTRGKGGAKRAVMGFSAILVLALAVLAYRQAELGRAQTSPLVSVATDLSPTAYTVGLVAHQVPSSVPYQYGLTYGDAIVHQLPSAVTELTLGPAHDTGTQVFRNRIIHLANPDAGYGFSLPAEAYLNFGLVGLLVVPLLAGALFDWAYSRSDAQRLRPVSLTYVVLVATLPLAWRSDAVTQIKGVLYPLIMIQLVVWFAQRFPSRRAG